MRQQDEEVKDFQLKWFDIVMGEYNSLRNESADSLKNQQSIINYGLTAIGVLIAFSANLWGKDSIVESIYVLFIPFMCNLIILIWNGEVRRMSRAGQYIQKIEEKLHKELSAKSNINIPALEWESFLRRPIEVEDPNHQVNNSIKRMIYWVKGLFSFLFRREKNNKIKSNYIAIILMFGGLSLFSILLGIGHNLSMFSNETNITAYEVYSNWFRSEFHWLMLYMGALVFDILFFIYHYRYFQRVKK